MFSNFFGSVLNKTSLISIDLSSFFICMGSAIVLGVFMAKMYSIKSRNSQSFSMSIALLPLAVAMVIMMVNDNLGTGVAVAGAFSLVRFRSVAGTAKEIIAIFSAMCTGLAIGMGYIAFAGLFSVIACFFALILNSLNFGGEKTSLTRMLQITIPENLNYTNVFDDIFGRFTKEATLTQAKTTNMGSLFKLTYEITLRSLSEEKEFIDELRCRNGNLEISIGNIFTNGL